MPRLFTAIEIPEAMRLRLSLLRAPITGASSARNPSSEPHSLTKRVSVRPATAASKSASYFAIDSVDQCGARTSPTRRSWPSSSAASTAAPIRGSQ